MDRTRVFEAHLKPVKHTLLSLIIAQAGPTRRIFNYLVNSQYTL